MLLGLVCLKSIIPNSGWCGRHAQDMVHTKNISDLRHYVRADGLVFHFRSGQTERSVADNLPSLQHFF